ncbi:MAG: DUF1365 domain-containing protein [Zoogloea sp.]|uniref:DUF1365 domain-containing protein n=1 Tax=Zoogloea sp. TaxID=49181 RepID=UPI002613B9C8|nr:DUF1365 domain-containing protein [Zoogloea sp.]MDD2989026.1 DUF1365 domain-containing protein [Zoogloea sp.]
MAAELFAPTVCMGAVMHERTRPVHNRFIYPLATLRIPLSRLDGLRVPLLGVDRPGVFSLRSRDHGARNGAPLLPWIRDLLARQGLVEADGEVVLQTMPRMFGFLFNPVSFWFCHDRQGGLRAVLAEVSNTFGEHHNYLVAHPDHRPITAGDELKACKVFHVSPFFPVRGEYRFRFSRQGGAVSTAIDYWEGGHCQLATRLSGREQPLSGRALLAWLGRLPLMSFGVVARIHWQALRLALRRVPFFRKPQPPTEELSS